MLKESPGMPATLVSLVTPNRSNSPYSRTKASQWVRLCWLNQCMVCTKGRGAVSGLES